MTRTRAAGHVGRTFNQQTARLNPVLPQTYEITFLGQAGSTLTAEFDDCEITTGPGITTLPSNCQQGALPGDCRPSSGSSSAYHGATPVAKAATMRAIAAASSTVVRVDRSGLAASVGQHRRSPAAEAKPDSGAALPPTTCCSGPAVTEAEPLHIGHGALRTESNTFRQVTGEDQRGGGLKVTLQQAGATGRFEAQGPAAYPVRPRLGQTPSEARTSQAGRHRLPGSPAPREPHRYSPPFAPGNQAHGRRPLGLWRAS